MEEFKPKGTPEANEEARKKLALHLTGNADATLGEMIDAVDGQNPEIIPPAKRILKSMNKSVEEFTHPFLLGVEDYIDEWEQRSKMIEGLTKEGASKVARRLLHEILVEQTKMKDAMDTFVSEATQHQKRELGELQTRLSKLKMRLQDIMQKSQYESQEDFGE